MGAIDFTDGTYCWSESLTHYIENHHLRLPALIVEHINAQEAFPTDTANQVPESIETNKSWWITQKGWSQEVTSSSFSFYSDQQAINFLRNYDRKTIDFGPTSPSANLARERMVQQLRKKLK